MRSLPAGQSAPRWEPLGDAGTHCLPQDMKDDYVFECEAGSQRTKLTILQSLGDPLYYGKIQPCTDDEEADGQASPSQ